MEDLSLCRKTLVEFAETMPDTDTEINSNAGPCSLRVVISKKDHSISEEDEKCRRKPAERKANAGKIRSKASGGTKKPTDSFAFCSVS